MDSEITPEIAKVFNLKQSGGALLSDIESGGPAAKAGLQRGDIVLALNGQPVEGNNSFRLKLSMTLPGSTVRLKILRNGSEIDVPVTVGEMPAKALLLSRTANQKSGDIPICQDQTELCSRISRPCAANRCRRAPSFFLRSATDAVCSDHQT